MDKAKDRKSVYRVLVLDHCTPTPDRNISSVTAINMMLLLRDMGFQVTFIPEDNFYMSEYTPDLQRVGIEVLYAPYCKSVDKHIKESGHRYDLVLVFHVNTMNKYLQAIRKYCPQAKLLFKTTDLHYLKTHHESELSKNILKKKKTENIKKMDMAMIRAADASIVHSNAELEILNKEIPETRIHTFPPVLDIIGTKKTFEFRHNIGFFGEYQHKANIDAIICFVKEIMPEIRKYLPNVRFHIIGSCLPIKLQKLVDKDIIVTEFVENLPFYLDRIRIFVAPFWYGAEIKRKIGIAMSVGLPVVSTSIAAEEMELIDGEHILIANEPKAFAKTVVKLYENEMLWTKLSKAGLKFAKSTYGAESAWKKLNHILSDIGFPKAEKNKYPLTVYFPAFSFLSGVRHRSPRDL